jgi:hypothetical protein
VEDNYPVLRAPSIPKLNKTNISSPLKGEGISSAAQLRRSRFSFLKKPSLNPEGLKKEVEEKKESTSSIKVVADSLIETNRILVEIQNQLAIDFATRIAEDKKQVSKIRSAKSKKRFAEKEAAIETAMGIAKTVGNQVNKILAPAKSIFDKIKEFFLTIFTGLLANAALDWLSDENNRKKFLGVLKFLLDHWKWIVGALVVGKFLGFLLKVVSVAKKLKQFIDFFRKKPPGSGPCGCDDKPKGPSGGPTDPCAPVLNCIKDNPPNLEAFAEKLSKTSKFKPIFDLLPSLTTLRPKPINAPKPQTTAYQRYLQSLPPGVREDAIKGGRTASPMGDALIIASAAAITYAAIDALGALGIGALTRAGAGATRSGSAGALNNIIRGPNAGTLNNIRGFSRLPNPNTLIKRSEGGPVGGRGSGKVDSIPAMLAPGEFVIKEAAARLFKPLLSDINESAGRLWGEFKQAVIKLLSLTSAQNDNAKKFSKTLDDLNKYFKDKKQKETIKNMSPMGGMGGGEVIGTVGSSPEIKTPKISPSKISDTSISNTESPKSMASMIKMPELNLNPKNIFQKTEQIFPVQPVIFDGNQSSNFNDNGPKQQNLSFNFNIQNVIKQNDLTPKKRSSSSPNIIPINMPTVRGKMPQIQMPQVPQTEVPAISSVNMANPYMQLTPSLYGIFV